MGNTLKFLFEYNEYINNIMNSDKDDYIYDEIMKRSRNNYLMISEGLIRTHPLDKSVDILKRRFTDQLIEIEEDGEIFIDNQPTLKLDKYIPIVTNLGYFISKLTFDGRTWLKEYDGKSKPIAFILEPKYDYEVEIPEFLYHTSPLKFKDKILKNGLSPRSGNKLSNHPERIYLMNDLERSIWFGNFLNDEDNNKYYKQGYCIYKVKTSDIKKLYSDINLRNGGFYTVDNIYPENIELLREVKY